MKKDTVTETKVVDSTHMCNIEALIRRLNEIRAMTNQPINLMFAGGGSGFGYRIHCSWERPLTEEELAKQDALEAHARECEKEMRRQDYLRLKEEFEGE
jgi:hypothetical protein